MSIYLRIVEMAANHLRQFNKARIDNQSGRMSGLSQGALTTRKAAAVRSVIKPPCRPAFLLLTNWLNHNKAAPAGQALGRAP
jgi:hypothetical protein